ncbi:MAG: hypothetical protein Q9M17_02860 [Mariprofundus sp.]|nr:hypothetical protein [Mariprofundus sp.]
MNKLIMLFAFLMASAFAVVPASYAGDHGHDSKTYSEKSSDYGSDKDDKSESKHAEKDDKSNKDSDHKDKKDHH